MRFKIEMIVNLDEAGANVESIKSEVLDQAPRTTARIKLKAIALARVEGRKAEQLSRPAQSYADADKILREWAASAPESGTHRVDFQLMFDDGSQFEGHYAMTRRDTFKTAILAPHVVEYVRFHAGLSDMGLYESEVRDYFAQMEVDIPKFRDLWERYDLGQGNA